eukprot:c1989_g1_i1.p2 GENE.c1989_g1_i1~~c1989_g1_i1.p2  ORF type:complete len:108 (+),score=10.88 c1989_g1_i1:96-419(+)
MFSMHKLMKFGNKKRHAATSYQPHCDDKHIPDPKTGLAIAVIPDSPCFRPRMNRLTKADRAAISNTWETHIAPNRAEAHTARGVTRRCGAAVQNRLAKAEWDKDDNA